MSAMVLRATDESSGRKYSWPDDGEEAVVVVVAVVVAVASAEVFLAASALAHADSSLLDASTSSSLVVVVLEEAKRIMVAALVFCRSAGRARWDERMRASGTGRLRRRIMMTVLERREEWREGRFGFLCWLVVCAVGKAKMLSFSKKM